LILVLSGIGSSKLLAQKSSRGKTTTELTDSIVWVNAESLTKADFIEKVWDYVASPEKWAYKDTLPAIVDFYADWCAPCRIASPILNEIATYYRGRVKVFKINTQNERELAAIFGISQIPAFLYIPTTGRPAMTYGIGRTKEDTRSMFEKGIEQHFGIRK
jgi:thiol-disulfide isomerase/thioredoxin